MENKTLIDKALALLLKSEGKEEKDVSDAIDSLILAVEGMDLSERDKAYSELIAVLEDRLSLWKENYDPDFTNVYEKGVRKAKKSLFLNRH